jgi:hypothetical protein
MEQPREPDMLLSPGDRPSDRHVPRTATNRELQVHDVAHWLYNSNPLYAISAMLVFWGLHSSFNTHGHALRVFALMGGLVAYTILVALAAYVVIRLGKVWDDGRTLLVLLVLMFLGISVSFDDALMADLRSGTICELAGLLAAVLVSEGLLRGLRLRLPLLFRIPYYLLLGLFFVYPPAFCWTFTDPYDPRVPWALWAFPTVAAILALTLLPAVRRGSAYTADNGSPWRWPCYPWTLFVVMGPGICGRSYYLCVSMHQAGGTATIFAPYFVVPLLLVACIVILEIGLVARHAITLGVALVAAALLLPLAMIPPGSRLGDDFLHKTFVPAIGCTPLWATALAVALFYMLAMVRRVRGATVALSAALLLLAVLTPKTPTILDIDDAHGLPILMLALLQAMMAVRRRSSARWLTAATCVVAALSLDFRHTAFLSYRGAIPAHLMLAVVLLLGVICRDRFGRLLRYVGALFLLGATSVALFAAPEDLGNVPASWLTVYPLAILIIALIFGYALHNRLYYVAAAAGGVCWLGVASTQGYRQLRQTMAGADYILGGMVCLALALAVSWTKTARGRRWLARSRTAALQPPAVETAQTPPAGGDC